MQEIELKFQVPPQARADVREAVAAGSAQMTALRALYVDTPSLALARAGVALRLRQEGEHWVQTLKGRGDGLMQRLEHEVPLPPQAGTPGLDPTRHAGTPAGAALQAALAAAGEGMQALQPLYRTEIERLHRRVQVPGALVELAYDTGWLLAGERRLAVDELELELIDGAPAGLLVLAADWVEQHGLWWDCRTKSERGTRLALGLGQVPPAVAAGAQAIDSPPARVQAALGHALPNWAELASELGSLGHRQQLRLALQALAEALRAWPQAGAAPQGGGPAGSAPEQSEVPAHRDPAPSAQSAQSLASAWQPLANAPDAGPGSLDAALLTSRPLQRLLLQTLALAQSPAAG